VEQWGQMMTMLEGISLTERTDTAVWMLEKSSNLTTKSVYKIITFPGIVDLRMKDIWETKLNFPLDGSSQPSTDH